MSDTRQTHRQNWLRFASLVSRAPATPGETAGVVLLGNKTPLPVAIASPDCPIRGLPAYWREQIELRLCRPADIRQRVPFRQKTARQGVTSGGLLRSVGTALLWTAVAYTKKAAIWTHAKTPAKFVLRQRRTCSREPVVTPWRKRIRYENRFHRRPLTFPGTRILSVGTSSVNWSPRVPGCTSISV